MKALWEKAAPFLAGIAVVWMLVVPIGGYELIHSTQTSNQTTLKTTASEVTMILQAFGCSQKAINGLLQDVPLAFVGDKNAADYATIAKACKVPQTPASP